MSAYCEIVCVHKFFLHLSSKHFLSCHKSVSKSPQNLPLFQTQYADSPICSNNNYSYNIIIMYIARECQGYTMQRKITVRKMFTRPGGPI